MLEPGWNLVGFPAAAKPSLEREAARYSLRLWSVANALNSRDERAATHPLGATSEPGQGYWVYSELRLDLTFEGEWPESAALSPDVGRLGWQFLSADALRSHSDVRMDRILGWDRQTQGFVDIHPGSEPSPGEGYFVRFAEVGVSEEAPKSPELSLVDPTTLWGKGPELKRPQPPTRFSATAQARAVRLWWYPPRLLADGSRIHADMVVSYRVFRDGLPVATVGQTVHVDEGLEFGKTYRYHATAIVQDPSGDRLESVPSPTIELPVFETPSTAVPGSFELPSEVSAGRVSASFPRTALAKDGKAFVAHLVYFERSRNSGAVLQYRHSRQAGKQGTFSAPVSLASLVPDAEFIALALGAKNKRVFVAWIQRAGKSRPEDIVYGRESVDGGKTFGAVTKIRDGLANKHSLSLAYDRYDDLHLVWGEASKVYYLKNLEGAPANVFDQRKRTPATEPVRYLAQYEPDSAGDCRCEGCWCPESYPLSDEPNPKENGKPFGPYIFRTEEAVVAAPSLHVDDEKLTIIGHQIRRWDDDPVPHDAWQGMIQNPVYSDQVVFGSQLTRRIVGWRQVWKHAYEANDETLWAGLGTQFQYRYQGTWHQEHQIKVAQRPLVAGAWSGADAGDAGHEHLKRAVFRVGAWKDDHEQQFRISVVHEGSEGAFGGRPSHPQVYTAPDGEMVAVFEKVQSNGSYVDGQAPIHVAFSQDGGLTWSGSEVVAYGAAPHVAVAAPHETLIVYSAAANEDGPQIEAVRRIGTSAFSSAVVLSRSGPRAPFASHGVGAISAQRPALSTLEELFLVAWVKKGFGIPAGDRIVVSRSARVFDVARLNIGLPERVTENQSVPVTITAENKFHMRVNDGSTVRVVHKSPSPVLSGAGTVVPLRASELSESRDGFGVSLASAPQSVSSNLGLPVEGADGRTPFELTLEAGAARFITRFESASLANGDVMLGVSRTDLAASSDAALDQAYSESRVRLVPGNAGGNYARAVLHRDELLKSKVHAASGDLLYYQVEYRSDTLSHHDLQEHARFEDPDLWDSPEYRDAKHLAGFERVWVYTQGVALAQLAREEQAAYRKKAQGLARYLCQHVVRDPQTKQVLGWPFSWNTLDDAWKDARLVTGANAWAVHGLGVFLTSEAYRLMPQGTVKETLKGCYRDALEGLKTHKRTLELDGREVVLMTAGWTTEGLVFSDAPHRILTTKGQPLTQNPNEVWGYYSVLDAIGYDEFEETFVRSCLRGGESGGASCEKSDSGGWVDRPVVQEAEWDALRRRVAAQNVVTEHNLDVLSVLNHALNHGPALGFSDDELRSLTGWRDQLRDGVFYGLYDVNHWKPEFREALVEVDGLLSDGRARTEAQTAFLRMRRHAIQKALEDRDLGRVVTGGALVPSKEKGYSLTLSPHAAIDNCSWLSLSVDHQILGALAAEDHAPYVERLAACLEYTVIQYVKDLSYEASSCDAPAASCPPAKTYRGTHYFQNAFRDPYIEPSELQESSYHLEATMGLTLGLLRFAKAHPEHPSARGFLEDAENLWSGAQAFVQDHNFPYSSQRIHNLSTRLSSSTAVVWFIDVYDAFHPTELDIDVAPPTPSLDNVIWALTHLAEEIRSSSSGHHDGLLEFGTKLILARGKLISKFGTRLQQSLDELGAFSPALSLPLVAGIETIAFLGGSQVDSSLEHIVASAGRANSAYWEESGVVRAEEVVAQPLGAYFRPESEIVQGVPIYPLGPKLDSPLSNEPFEFQEDRVYRIQIEWLGVESALGNLGILTPTESSLWSVYRLKTERPASKILHDFVQSHRLWALLAPMADGFSEPMRDSWLYLLELAIRGEFGWQGAEQFSRRRGDASTIGGASDSRSLDGVKRQAPFFFSEDDDELATLSRERAHALFQQATGTKATGPNWDAFNQARISEGLGMSPLWVLGRHNIAFTHLKPPEEDRFLTFTRLKLPAMPMQPQLQEQFFDDLKVFFQEKIGPNRAIRSSRGHILDGWKLGDRTNQLVTAYAWNIEFLSGTKLNYLWVADWGVIPREAWTDVVAYYDGLTPENASRWERETHPKEKTRVQEAVHQWLVAKLQAQGSPAASTGIAPPASLGRTASVPPHIEHVLALKDVDWIKADWMPLDPAATGVFLGRLPDLQERIANGLKDRGFEPGPTQHYAVNAIRHPRSGQMILLDYRLTMKVGDTDQISIHWKAETEDSDDLVSIEQGHMVLAGQTDEELVKNFSLLSSATRRAWDTLASKAEYERVLSAGERVATAFLQQQDVKLGRKQGQYLTVSGRLMKNSSPYPFSGPIIAMPANDLTAQRHFFERNFPSWIEMRLDKDGTFPKENGQYKFVVRDIAPEHGSHPPYAYSFSKEVTVDSGQGELVFAYWQPGVVPGVSSSEVVKNYWSMSSAAQSDWEAAASPYDRERVEEHRKDEVYQAFVTHRHQESKTTPARIPPNIGHNDLIVDEQSILSRLPWMPLNSNGLEDFKSQVESVLRGTRLQSVYVDGLVLELDSVDQYATSTYDGTTDPDFRVVTGQSARMVFRGSDAQGISVKRELHFRWDLDEYDRHQAEKKPQTTDTKPGPVTDNTSTHRGETVAFEDHEPVAYWYETTKKPVHWFKTIDVSTGKKISKPSPKSMADKFNDYAYVSELIKKMFVRNKTLDYGAVKDLVADAKTPNISRISFVFHERSVKDWEEALGRVFDNEHFNQAMYIDVRLWDQEGWSEVNRFYNPLNTPAEMGELAKKNAQSSGEYDFNVIHHQLKVLSTGIQPKSEGPVPPESIQNTPIPGVETATDEPESAALRKRLLNISVVLDKIFDPINDAVVTANSKGQEVSKGVRDLFFYDFPSVQNDVHRAQAKLRPKMAKAEAKEVTEMVEQAEQGLELLIVGTGNIPVVLLAFHVTNASLDRFQAATDTLLMLNKFRTVQGSTGYMKAGNSLSVVERAVFDAALFDSTIALDHSVFNGFRDPSVVATNTKRLLNAALHHHEDLAFAGLLGPTRKLVDQLLTDPALLHRDRPLLSEAEIWLQHLYKGPPLAHKKPGPLNEMKFDPNPVPTFNQAEDEVHKQTVRGLEVVKMLESARAELENTWAVELSLPDVLTHWALAEEALVDWESSQPVPAQFILATYELVKWTRRHDAYEYRLRTYSTGIRELSKIMEFVANPNVASPPLLDYTDLISDIPLVRYLEARSKGTRVDQSLIQREYEKWLSGASQSPF